MDKLSAIFEDPDPKTRKTQLLEFARSLNVNTLKIKKENGEIDENQLAVMIFQELKGGARRKKQRLMLAIIGFAFFSLYMVGMYVVSQGLMTMKKSPPKIFDEDQKK